MGIATPILLSLLFALFGYINGNVLYAYIIGKKFCNVDIYLIGSGNPGSTNLRRATKKKHFVILAFCCDALKSYLSVLVAAGIYYGVSKHSGINMTCPYIIYLAGLFALIGHCYPFMYIVTLCREGKNSEKIKHNHGGRGVACMAGFVFSLNPWFWVIGLAIWFTTMKLSKMVSLASVVAVGLIAFFQLVPYFRNCLYMYQIALGTAANPIWIKFALEKNDNLSFYSNYHIWVIFGITLLASLIVCYRHKENIYRIIKGTEYKFSRAEKEKAN
ncbi:MAG: glycerol-3-phosphate 1-O-acyltransferase PlsY [Mycoplasmoidaceae bacterium]|nr:MAG: glycerol-3-phosphate 1-O-acyltransferase PlsY [Mycoplasmoidaceae bacterium]